MTISENISVPTVPVPTTPVPTGPASDRPASDRPAAAGPAPARSADERAPARRLSRLFDPDSLVPLAAPDDSGVHIARGLIDGRAAVAYCTDGTRMGGALGMAGCRHIVTAIETALRDGHPVVGLWHSGGARLAEGVEALDGVGAVFAAMIRASGAVPQVSLVLGPAAGGAAYGPALTDVVVMTGGGQMFVTGPDIVRQVTGERIDMAGLGGAEVHSRRSGVSHVSVATEAEGYERTRRIVGLLAGWATAGPGSVGAAPVGAAPVGAAPVGDAPAVADPAALLPANPARAYDIHPLVAALLDTPAAGGDWVELQPRWAPNLVVGLGRLAGRPIGLLANNPIRKGGCLDSLSAEKGARFVRMCDAFGIPLVVLVDVPGYLPGVRQEWDGVLRRGAKLLHAFGASVVPRVTLVVRKSYGGAYIAMNSRSLGATRVLAWPDAEVAVMSATAAVGVLHRRALAAAPAETRDDLRAQLAAEHARTAGGLGRALALGSIDEVVDPPATRRRLIEVLAGARPARGSHTNIPL